MFRKLWREGLRDYDELCGIQWDCQSTDGAITKAPLGGGINGRNPTDRGKSGTKRSLLADGTAIVGTQHSAPTLLEQRRLDSLEAAGVLHAVAVVGEGSGCVSRQPSG